MELKHHGLMFIGVCVGMAAYLLLVVHGYGRIFAIFFNVFWLDPDNDQFGKGRLHRWWYSHSIFPGCWITWAFAEIIPAYLWFYPFVGFCGYAVVHLLGDLGSSKGFGRIKMWPFPGSIDARLWIALQIGLFITILVILI